MAPNKNRMLKQGISGLRRRMDLLETNVFRLVARRAEFDGETQKLRGWMILDLKAMVEECQARSQDKRLTMKQRQKWTQLLAQVTKVLAHIMREFDTYKIPDFKKDVDSIAKLLEKVALEDENQYDQADSSSGSSASGPP